MSHLPGLPCAAHHCCRPSPPGAALSSSSCQEEKQLRARHTAELRQPLLATSRCLGASNRATEMPLFPSALSLSHAISPLPSALSLTGARTSRNAPPQNTVPTADPLPCGLVPLIRLDDVKLHAATHVLGCLESPPSSLSLSHLLTGRLHRFVVNRPSPSSSTTPSDAL